MDSTEHIVCSRGTAKVGPDRPLEARLPMRGILIRRTVKPLPIPSVFKLIFTPLAVPPRIAAFCCKKKLQTTAVNGKNTTKS